MKICKQALQVVVEEYRIHYCDYYMIILYYII